LLTDLREEFDDVLPNSIGGGLAADPFSAPEESGVSDNNAVTPATPVPAPEAAMDPFGGGGGAELEAEAGALGAAMEARKGIDGPDGGAAAIELAKWDPKTPYLEALKKADDGELLAVYFRWKAKNADSSAFYLDVADFFLGRKEEKLALRVLTNVAEMDLESVPLLRILGHRLDQLGELEVAELVFREVKELRGDEPQSWRDLALVLEKRGEFQEALDLLWLMVINEWDSRFPQIQMIALMELNALVARQGEKLNLSAVDERFLKNLDCDVRIVLTWDADNTDMDLWVTGPAGERCYYGEPDTMTGGHMSEDFTGGYGPEVFEIRRALRGDYTVEVDYYGNRQQVLAGATTVQAVLITNWGRPNEKREAVTLRLKDEEEMVKVGALKFGK
jgi:tetratricopeptide (TPR) repeat protein